MILTFQFHESLCKASNHKGPLHKCDIYNSKEAGQKLRNMMKKGSRYPWPSVLKEFTDGKSDKIDPSSMLNYFDPLLKWLRKQNLTDRDWQCDSYINEEKNVFMSYENRNNKRKVSKSFVYSGSSRSFLFNFKIIICFKIIMIIIFIIY